MSQFISRQQQVALTIKGFLWPVWDNYCRYSPYMLVLQTKTCLSDITHNYLVLLSYEPVSKPSLELPYSTEMTRFKPVVMVLFDCTPNNALQMKSPTAFMASMVYYSRRQVSSWGCTSGPVWLIIEVLSCWLATKLIKPLSIVYRLLDVSFTCHFCPLLSVMFIVKRHYGLALPGPGDLVDLNQAEEGSCT